MLDSIDVALTNILQNNARTTVAQIARDLDMAPSGIHERIKKLEKRGFITGYHAKLDARALGKQVTAFLMIKTEDRVGSLDSASLLAEIEEIQEVHHIAGEDCYLVKLRCADNQELGRILRDKIGAIDSVRESRTSVVLETVKEDSSIPLGSGAPLDVETNKPM